jgi:hypothetical protein
MIKKLLIFGCLVLFSAHLSAQTADSYAGTILHDYFKQELEFIRTTPGFTPPVASRALGYSGITAYESVVHGMPNRLSLAGVLPELETLPLPVNGQDYHWPEVANIAMHDVILHFYSNTSLENISGLTALRDEYTVLHEFEEEASVITASQDFGAALAEAIITYASADGQPECQFSNFPAEYVPPAGEGLWVPLTGQSALQPYWGDKRCFVVPFITNEMIADAPPEFSSDVESVLYAEALEVYEAVNNLTVEEQNIAEYWADGGGSYTPPGHSFSMLRFVMIDENEDLGFASEAYARLGVALADAFVQCWKTKYNYNLLRPITYINNHIDENWTTVVGTPPFPEYTSGHSSQSGAFGAVMTELYGMNYTFTDSTYGDQFGGPRTWNSFVESAEETAISRLYGGIHYPIGNTNGSVSGIMIGNMVSGLFNQLVNTPEETALANLELYPNPSPGQVSLNLPNNDFTGLTVWTLTGQKVYEEILNSRVLDLSHLEKGVYIFVVEDVNGNAQRTRWIKE